MKPSSSSTVALPASVFAFCTWLALGVAASAIGNQLWGWHGSVIIILPALALCTVGGLVSAALLLAPRTRHLPVLTQAAIAWAIAASPIVAFTVYAAASQTWSEASLIVQVGTGLALAGLVVAAVASKLGARVLHRAQSAA